MKNVTLKLFLLLLTAVILPSDCGPTCYNDGKTDAEDKNFPTVDKGSGIESFENIYFKLSVGDVVIQSYNGDNNETRTGCSEFICQTEDGITQCVSNKDKCNLNGSLVIGKNGDVMMSNNKGGEMVISAKKNGDMVTSTNQRGPLRLVITTRDKDVKTALLKQTFLFLFRVGPVGVILYLFRRRQTARVVTTTVS